MVLARFQDIADLPQQLVVTILVTTLLFVLSQSVRRKFLDYWVLGWVCQSLGLGFVLAGRTLNGVGMAGFFAAAFAAQFAYAFLTLMGCRNLSRSREMTRRHLVGLFVCAPLAGCLAVVADLATQALFHVGFEPYTRVYSLQAVLLALPFFVAWRGVRAVSKMQPREPGPRVLALALLLLTAYFAHLLPLAVMHVFLEEPVLLVYLHYAVAYQFVLAILLAFGMVIMAMDSVRRELAGINADLAAAKGRLEQLASRDPLTEALNRHAFYSLVERNRQHDGHPIGGTVAVLDIDDLKPINDRWGHAAGDAAIRTVSKAVRSLVRSDDLLFRWGGDEFLVVLPNVNIADAKQRFERLNLLLRQVLLQGLGEPVDIHVSTGLAAFNDLRHLELAIDQADEAMYARKLNRKGQIRTPLTLPR